MESFQQFLGGVGIIVVAGVVFAAAQRQEINYGSIADWAGAFANFLVVCVTLWLALSDRRTKAEAERSARRRSREALTTAIDNLVTLTQFVVEAYGNAGFPELLERKSFKYQLQATMRTWERVVVSDLTDLDQALALDADAPFHELWQAISTVLAQNEHNAAVTTQFNNLIAASGELEDLRRLLK
jgi:hypothetical protein